MQLNIFSYLLHIIIQNISEVLPTTFWYQDRVAIVAFDLRYSHVTALLIFLDVEVEILVLNSQMFVLRPEYRLLSISLIHRSYIWQFL
mgnify:CR=1 FL=1